MANENNNDKNKIDIQRFQKILDIINQQQNLNLLIDDFKGAPLTPKELNADITKVKNLMGINPQDSNTQKLKELLNSKEFNDKLSLYLGGDGKNDFIDLKDKPMPPNEENIMLQINKKNKADIDYQSTLDIHAPSKFKK